MTYGWGEPQYVLYLNYIYLSDVLRTNLKLGSSIRKIKDIIHEILFSINVFRMKNTNLKKLVDKLQKMHSKN